MWEKKSITDKIDTDRLENITESVFHKIITVQANPSEGFCFPYVLRLPGATDRKNMSIFTRKRFLIFDMLNNGVHKSINQCVHDTITLLESTYSVVYKAISLGYPVMIPVIPRLGVKGEMDGFGVSYSYEHSLDRQSVYIRELMTIDSHFNKNRDEYVKKNIDYELYYDIDKQVKSMLVHAIKYLNSYNHCVQERVIMDGYSASGAFVDRFANLYPEIVEMVISGSTMDVIMLPMAKYNGEVLHYPVGIADYKIITGKEFSLFAHNSIARLIYKGKSDNNNTVGTKDCYYSETTAKISRLFGLEILQRAKNNIKLYQNAGGKGIFILENGVGHECSSIMRDYQLEFIVANANSDTIVYPLPKNFNLEATIIY